ncbi:unnamed protein product [Cladocopium goreaui]|uniref:Uncharacterized protein n=1 Tax=Cladocopium goreaui TaxID=2562237 RepID=A0A9P1G8R2_9DINO|nr:unnamed protein product [Cladocopium goreaui]
MAPPVNIDHLLYRLKAFGAPKVLLLAVLLVIWTDPGLSADVAEPPFKWIEFFAGKAEATNQFQVGGFHSAKLDILYMHAQPGKLNPMDLTSEAGMGTALATVLRGDWVEGFLSHFGLKCASWTTINSGTSSRSPCSAIGNTEYPSVVCANLLTSRMILIMMVVVCLNGCILLEQPSNSFVEYYPRFRELIQLLQASGGPHAVHRTMWYMFHYNGPTPKRHLAFANSSAIGGLDCGPLVGWKKIKKEREAKGEAPPQLVQKYHDKQGKLRYKGLPALRSSEHYPADFGKKLVSMFADLIKNKSGMPRLPSPCPSAEATFASMSYDDKWHDASMVEVCFWLRGGKDLQVPPSFRPLLPHRL